MPDRAGSDGVLLVGDAPENDVRVRDFRRNRVMFAFDGAFFWVFFSFFGFQTVMVAYARRFTEDPYVLGSFPLAWFFGGVLLQPVGSWLIQGRARIRRLLLSLGVAQRLPYVATAWAAFYAVEGETLDGLLAMGFFMVGGLLTGLVIPVYIEFIGRVLDPMRRGSAFGLRNTLSGVFGLCGALSADYVISGNTSFIGRRLLALGYRHVLEFPSNYAWGFAIGVTFFVLCFIPLGCWREQPVDPTPPAPFGEFLRQVRAVWREDAVYRRYLWAQCLGAVYVMNFATYLVHGQDLAVAAGWENAKAAFVGQSTIVFFVAQALGGRVLGAVLDRRGALTVLRVMMGAGVLTPVLALTVSHLGEARPDLFLSIFALQGVLMAAFFTGSFGFILEYAPEKRRLFYLALNETSRAPAYFLAWFLGGFLVSRYDVAVSFVVAALVSLLALLALPPRVPSPSPPPLVPLT